MSSWDDFVRQVDAEAAAEGPLAVAELEALHAYYRLARHFTERRQKLALTQAELSARSGIAQSEISRFERGRSNPTYQTLLRLCDALDCDVELVARESSSPGPSRSPRP